MRVYLSSLLCVPAMLLVAAVPASAGPRARRSSPSWQLDVRFQDPQRLAIRLPGRTTTTTYWYVVYEVTNRTGRDVQFLPSVNLVTDTLQVVEGGAMIHPRVYDAIIALHKKDFPFLAPPTRVTGKLLQGEENARATVAVFRNFDPQASSFTIYASGFSSEIERSPNPAFDAKLAASPSNPRFFLLRRTLGIVYDLPGDPTTRHLAKPIRRTRMWVMR